VPAHGGFRNAIYFEQQALIMDEKFAKSAQFYLTKQAEVANQLLEILRSEYESLKVTDSAALETITELKRATVEDLDKLNQAWQGILRAQKITITKEGIQGALAANDPRQQFKIVDTFAHLGDTMMACQRQNTMNGAAITLRQQTIQDALDILRSGNTAQSTYGPRGQRATQSIGVAGYTIGKA